MMPAGRPTDYTPELATRICMAIAASTKSIKEICKENDGFPCYQTIHEWKWMFPEFADLYARAKREQADMLAEEITDIADNGTNDWMQSHDKDNPGYVVNGEAIARSRLRVDTRKWIACKLLPKVYGDRQESKQEINLVVHEDDLSKLK